jgi:hypothetical protein
MARHSLPVSVARGLSNLGAPVWEAAYDRIRQAVRLLAPDGRPVAEFLLHIDGDDAWWRWSDEPFPKSAAEL